MLDYIVYIGRFQPFHIGHKKVIDFALTQAEKVIILIGSSNLHRSVKNPFTYDERIAMIASVYDRRWRDTQVTPSKVLERLVFDAINDHPYNDTAWIQEVNQAVSLIVSIGGLENPRIGIISYTPGETDVVASYFPKWKEVYIGERIGTINASEIRNQYFRSTPIISEFIPDEVRVNLREFAMTQKFKWLLREAKFLEEYTKEYGKGPFVTTDAVVEQAGHILLVERRDPPFQGALALPGGFLNPKETLVDCVVRELKEETRISDEKGELPPGMLKSYIKKQEVFDSPDRDPRARIITHAFHFEIPRKSDLLHVRGDDDAASAKWYNLADLEQNEFMGDHWFIIQKMLGITGA